MCRMRTEGTSYVKCAHYVQTRFVAKIDCGSVKCVKSDFHPPNCSSCSSCEQHYGEDVGKITAYVDDWCHLCEPWYGESARRRR